MDRIEIPILDAETDLESVLMKMKRGNVRAVVLDSPISPRVIEADLVVHALNKGRKKTLRQVQPRVRTIDLSSYGPQVPDQVPMPDDLRLQIEDRMDSKLALYAVVMRMPDKAMLLTRHEINRDQIGYGNDYWKCSSLSRVHYLETRDLVGGTICPHDGSICTLL